MSSTAPVNPHGGWFPRLRRFADKSWRHKLRTVQHFVRYAFPAIPIPVRISGGFSMLAWRNDLGNQLLSGDYEESEIAFVRRFVRRGMVVLDIGANEGLYAMFLARIVGGKGTVFAFEPSPRERRRLKINLWMNLFRNVHVEGLALSTQEGESNLYVVETGETGCNSLRPPDIHGSTQTISVKTITLDHFLSQRSIARIDFMKIDVEGAEWSVLQGAKTLLTSLPRPFVLIEMSDLRTRPWGYRANEIGKALTDLDFDLFRPVSPGELVPADMAGIEDGSYYNVVAVPRERASEISSLLARQCVGQPGNTESAVG